MAKKSLSQQFLSVSYTSQYTVILTMVYIASMVYISNYYMIIL